MITSPVRTFKTGAYTITRPGVTTYVAGLAVEASATVIASVDMSVQPATPEVLATLPEGQRTTDTRLVLCETALENRDVITIEGEGWTVFEVERWDHRGVVWYEAIVTRNRLGV